MTVFSRYSNPKNILIYKPISIKLFLQKCTDTQDFDFLVCSSFGVHFPLIQIVDIYTIFLLRDFKKYIYYISNNELSTFFRNDSLTRV